MPFRPAPVPTALSAVGLAILISLGSWQLSRHGGAMAHLAVLEQRHEGALLGNADLHRSPADLSWHRARLQGRFVEAHAPMLVTGRYEMGTLGYEVVAIFEVDDGPRLLVNRGWIPRDELPDDLESLRPAGPTAVEGLLMEVEDYFPNSIATACDHGPAFIPASGTAPDRWRPNRLGAMADAHPEPLAPVYLVVGEGLRPGSPKDFTARPVTGYYAQPRAIPHLDYAATWFLIAGTLLVIWAAAGFRRGRLLQQEATGGHPRQETPEGPPAPPAPGAR